MSWQEKNRVSLRKEFVLQAEKSDANMAELCRRYEISRKTGYKWLHRYQQGEPLADQSKCPRSSPKQLSKEVIRQIIELREKYPYWGARKIQAILSRTETSDIPAKSSIHKILKKYGYIKDEKATNNHYQRFEHEAPNHLWQMDFKGHFAYEKGRCFPLTILDDHSRFSLALHACLNEQGETVKPILIEVFRRYGLPERINVDNGNPWGSLYECARYTTFSKWLIRTGVQVSYSRPAHPQTNGKEERFHRTLKLELLNANYFRDLEEIQQKFNDWRAIYNLERPHEGIGMQVPAERYKPSYRQYPEVLPQIEYSDDYMIKKVDCRGRIHINARQIFVGMPFAKEPLGIRHQGHSDIIELYYCHQKLGEMDLHLTKKNTLINLYSKRVTEFM
jgi:transposase InsO family protein